jgi:hypothetical protein
MGLGNFARSQKENSSIGSSISYGYLACKEGEACTVISVDLSCVFVCFVSASYPIIISHQKKSSGHQSVVYRECGPLSCANVLAVLFTMLCNVKFVQFKQ